MYGNNLYGQSSFGTDSTNEDIPEEYSIDLMKYLPQYYQDNKTMNELQKSIGKEIGRLNYDTDDLLKQFFINTATWGLDLWEKELGVNTDRSKPYTSRREILKAKLRGAGTTTKKMIKSVASAFSGGDVDVIEYPKEYRFVVQFIGILGIPPNMAGLINAIEEIKPAHLAYSFKYTYTVWNDLSNIAWDNGKTWTELRTYKGE